MERLNSVSREFAYWWPRHDIVPLIESPSQYRHPVVARIGAERMTDFAGLWAAMATERGY